MPLPVAHTLAGAAIYKGLDADGSFTNVRRLALVGLIVLLPDFDLIPGVLLGEPNRFHHGPSHSMAMVGVGALLAALATVLCCRWPLRRGLPQGAAGTALMVGALLASHLVLDAFNEDFRPPAGVPMFWPLSASPVQFADWFPHVNKLTGEGSPVQFVMSLFTLHNLWATVVEALTLVPVVVVVAWWRKRSDERRVALIAALAVLMWAAPAQAQEPEAVIQATVDRVRLSVGVVHRSGRAVPPLSAEDFRVFDNGVEQDVQLLLRPTHVPLRVALVIDNSPSMRPWRRTVQRAAISFMSGLGDRGCPYVLPFSDGVGPGRWGRYSPNSWWDFFARVPSGDGTSLFDALLIAISQLDMADELEDAANFRTPPAASAGAADRPAAGAQQEARNELMAGLARVIAELKAKYPFLLLGDCDLRVRPAEYPVGVEDAEVIVDDSTIGAILLLSDGADTSSVATMEQALTGARLANVPVFPVMLGAATQEPRLAAQLEEIARATGGLMTTNVAVTELAAAYREILAHLGSTYVLIYDLELPPDSSADSWHEIRVELRRPTLRTIVRPGYYR